MLYNKVTNSCLQSVLIKIFSFQTVSVIPPAEKCVWNNINQRVDIQKGMKKKEERQDQDGFFLNGCKYLRVSFLAGNNSERVAHEKKSEGALTRGGGFATDCILFVIGMIGSLDFDSYSSSNMVNSRFSTEAVLKYGFCKITLS